MRLLLAALLLLAPTAHAALVADITPPRPDTDTQVRFLLPGNGTVAWDFGDGNTSSQNPAAHQFAMAGLYTVTYRRGSDSGSMAILVRIPAHLYLNGTAGNATARPHLPHESLLVSQPWIIPVLVLLLGTGLLLGARTILKRRRIAPAELEAEAVPVEPDAPPELDLDAYLPMPEATPSAAAAVDGPPETAAVPHDDVPELTDPMAEAAVPAGEHVDDEPAGE